MRIEREVDRGVQGFLHRVAEHLGAAPEDEKREILRDLESHIHEALRSRVSEREPTLADLQGVLAEMDPPESYGESAEVERPASPASPGRRATGIAALCISLGSLVVAGLLFPLTGGGLVLWIPVFLFLAGQIAALALGIVAWSCPFGKAAVITSGGLIVLLVLFTA